MAKIEIKHRGRTLLVYESTSAKKGIQYTSYQVPDYSTDKRKLWTFANLEDAKAKAREIADGCAAGQQSVLALAPQQREIETALMALKPTGVALDRAAAIVAEALKFVDENDIVAACRFWADQGPNKRLSPKLAREGLADYKARRRGKISSRRSKTERSYLNTFETKFGERLLHEITTVEIGDFGSAQDWSRKTRNDWLGSLSLFFDDAVSRGWAKVNPLKAVKREKWRGGNIGILTPDQARAILEAVVDELKAGLALWCFAGMRISEVARLSWGQIDAGLKSGQIFMRADQALKKEECRSVPICDNLNAWLIRYRKAHGSVLSLKWTTEEGLSQLAKHIRRRAGFWVSNGPRHSYGTYHLKLHGDPAKTVDIMGTSLAKLEKHYRSRSDAATREVAAEWFEIYPAEENVIPMPTPNLNTANEIALG